MVNGLKKKITLKNYSQFITLADAMESYSEGIAVSVNDGTDVTFEEIIPHNVKKSRRRIKIATVVVELTLGVIWGACILYLIGWLR